jgi:D-alanyl-D-alanine carboxypeptidase
MFAVAPISNVEARIGSIQARVSPQSATSSSGSFDAAYLEATSGPESRVGFDPFGEAYDQAVEQSRIQVATALTGFSANRLQSYGTMSGIGSGSGTSVGRVGGYGPMQVPADLAAYGNGQLPPAALQSIGQGGHRLWAPAAQSWQAAVAAARADGVDLKVTDSYRTYDQQVDLAERKGLYKDGGLGATPGTSNHGWGLAVDVDVSDPRTQAWIKANGYRFGFVEAVPREPWHWEFRPGQA